MSRSKRVRSMAPTRRRTIMRFFVPCMRIVRGLQCDHRSPSTSRCSGSGLTRDVGLHRRSDDALRDKKIDGDAAATVFVGRLSYGTSEEQLRTTFEAFGSIRKVALIRDIGTHTHTHTCAWQHGRCVDRHCGG